VIPAFALGRSQEVLQAIAELQREKKIPELPVYLDSPMALEATKAHLKYPDELVFHADEELIKAPIDTEMFRVVETFQESMALCEVNRPHIVISASGMLTGGRVMHHLKKRLPDPRNAVLFVGYQAEGTKGRILLSGEKNFRIHHERVDVNADIFSLQNFSAHADWQDSINWVKKMPQVPQKIILNHGEKKSLESLKAKLESEFPSTEVVIPHHGSSVDV
jgi:metallo-beta-lactamase family protein